MYAWELGMKIQNYNFVGKINTRFAYNKELPNAVLNGLVEASTQSARQKFSFRGLWMQ